MVLLGIYNGNSLLMKDLLTARHELIKDINASRDLPITDEMREFDKRYAELQDEYGGIPAFFLGWKENPSLMTQYSTQSLNMMLRSLGENETIETSVKWAGTGFGTGWAASKYGKYLAKSPYKPLAVVGKGLQLFSGLRGAGGGFLGGMSKTMEKGFTTMDLLNEKGLDKFEIRSIKPETLLIK